MPQLLNTRPQNANNLLDELIKRFQLKNDAALCRRLKVPPPQVSKIRHDRLRVTPALLLKIYDATGLSIDDLRAWLYFGTEEDTAAPA